MDALSSACAKGIYDERCLTLDLCLSAPPTTLESTNVIAIRRQMTCQKRRYSVNQSEGSIQSTRASPADTGLCSLHNESERGLYLSTMLVLSAIQIMLMIGQTLFCMFCVCMPIPLRVTAK